MEIVVVYLIIINAIGCVLMLVDKNKAKQRHWRIPERVLMVTAVIGGSIGVLAGMKLFRHKTKHPKFTIGVPVILALQIVAAVFLLTM